MMMDTELDFAAINRIPVMVLDGDTARTGLHMPPQSHAAGDRSQINLKSVKFHVLILVRENPMIIGSELNQLFQETWKRRGWKRAAFDTPRKRAENLLADGFLIEQPVRDGGRQYLISAAGLAVICS